MKMKNVSRGKPFLLVLTLLLSAALAFTATGCSFEKNDEGFLKTLASGLEKRWKENDSQASKVYDSEEAYRNDLAKVVEIEANTLGDVSEFTFEDGELQDLATQYAEALALQVEGVKYYATDEMKYQETFEAGYNQRVRLLYLIDKSYDIPISDKYQQRLTDLCVEGEGLEELQTATDAITTALASTTLEKIDNYSFVGTVENPSELSLNDVSVDFVGYDESGTVATTTSSYLPTWEAGSKHHVEFFVEQDIVSASLYISFVYKDTNIVETDPVEVTLVNELQLDISLPQIPVEISYFNYGGTESTRCRITDISYNVDYWENSQAISTCIFVSGEKLFDEDGENTSKYCQVGWKLYDESDMVIDSGTLFTTDTKVGESFLNDEIYVSTTLLPGVRYRLELLNVES